MVRDLLAYVFYALHDTVQLRLLNPSLTDEQSFSVEGLSRLIDVACEIQRGGYDHYDIDPETAPLAEIQAAKDAYQQQYQDQLPDAPICGPGTFNKLIEALVSIHPDAEQKVITMISLNDRWDNVITAMLLSLNRNDEALALWQSSQTQITQADSSSLLSALGERFVALSQEKLSSYYQDILVDHQQQSVQTMLTDLFTHSEHKALQPNHIQLLNDLSKQKKREQAATTLCTVWQARQQSRKVYVNPVAQGDGNSQLLVPKP